MYIFYVAHQHPIVASQLIAITSVVWLLRVIVYFNLQFFKTTVQNLSKLSHIFLQEAGWYALEFFIFFLKFLRFHIKKNHGLEHSAK